MPVNPRAHKFLSLYLSTKAFPEVDVPPDLSETEVQELYDSLNVRFSGKDGEWMCFLGSAPGNAGYGDSKIKALAFLLDHLGLTTEDLS